MELKHCPHVEEFAHPFASVILGFFSLQKSQKMCAMVFSSRVFFGDGRPPTFNDGILIMGPYKLLRTWVDEFYPLLYRNNGSLDPGTCRSLGFRGSLN